MPTDCTHSKCLGNERDSEVVVISLSREKTNDESSGNAPFPMPGKQMPRYLIMTPIEPIAENPTVQEAAKSRQLRAASDAAQKARDAQAREHWKKMDERSGWMEKCFSCIF